MFTVSPWGRDYLASSATALSLALLIERKDGARFGFTNIRRFASLPAFTVRQITVPAFTYSPRGRLRMSNLQQSERPSASDNWEATLVMGAHLPEADVAQGKFFGAAYYLTFFDWRTHTPIMLRMRGKVGQRTLEGLSVTFKMRSLSQLMQAEVLDVTSPLSRARWGDPELAFFNLSGQTNDGFAARVSGAITGVDAEFPRRRFTLSGATGFPAGRFSGGTALFTSGANTGVEASILSYSADDGVFTLDAPLRFPLAPGDGVRVQIRAPLNLAEWLLFFGTGMYCPCEPGIPNGETATVITHN
jgi:hypothetical protein